MAVDPLRALFLDVGVDDKSSILALQNINRAADLTEAAFLRVAAAAKLAGATSPMVRANQALASSYNSLALSAARAQASMRATMTGAIASIQSGRSPAILERPGLAGAGDLPFTVLRGGGAPGTALALQTAMRNAPFTNGMTSSRARGRGNYGLGTSIFLATAGLQAGGYGFQQGANLQRSSLLASYASGQSPAAMRAQSLGVGRANAMRLAEATALTQEVAQLGSMTPEGQRQIASAGAGFHILESQVGASEASAAIYRLIKATSRSKEEFDAGTYAATRYAGAIYAAGNESAAGASEVFAMVQELEPLSQMMNLGANGTIALSAAFADLNATQRELFRGALTRMTIQGKLDPNNPIGSLLSIAERLRSMKSDSAKLSYLESLGFKNIRDVQTVSVMAASMDTFARSLTAVNGELQGTSTFGPKVSAVLGTMSGQWDSAKASMDAAAATITGSLAPGLGLLLSLLTGIGDSISAHPGLAMVLGIGAGGLGFIAARGLYRKHFGGIAGAEALAAMEPFERRNYGRTSRAMATILPVGVSKRLAFTGFGESLAEGAYLGSLAGVGRTSSLSLGLMRALPFGERLAGAAGARMAAGGIAGTALEAATGPVGWIIMALTLGAPLFERIGAAAHKMASQGGAMGAVLNTVSLIFDVLAAGGRILNKVFGWIGTGGKWLLNLATGGHYNDIVGGVNSGLTGSQNWINNIAANPSKAGPQTPKAPGNTVNIYTGGSQSGYQTAIDEVARRAARTMPSNNYGGIPV